MEENFDQKLLDGMRVDTNFNEPILHQVIRIAIYDEFHAYETYAKVIDRFGEVAPFSNILLSEQRHFMALIEMATKYNVPVPINNWADKIIIPTTLVECCEVGVAAEIDNIAMYDDLIEYTTTYPDLLDVLFRLQAASYNNHLVAFRRCVAIQSGRVVSDNQTIYQQSSTHNLDDTIGKLNDLSSMVAKISNGDITQNDINGFLSSANISLLAGAILGAIGTGVVANMLQQQTQNEGE